MRNAIADGRLVPLDADTGMPVVVYREEWRRAGDIPGLGLATGPTTSPPRSMNNAGRVQAEKFGNKTLIVIASLPGASKPKAA